MKFSELPTIQRGIALLWLLILSTISCYNLVRSIRHKRRAAIIVINAVLPVFTYWFLQLLDYAGEVIFGIRETAILYGADASLIFGVTLFLTAAEVILFAEETVWVRSHITPRSVKEAVDKLPKAMCFCMKNGMPILVNLKMHELSYTLFGRSLLSGKLFWDQLESGEVRDGSRTLTFAGMLIALLHDGTVWMFERKTISLRYGDVYQITAIDVTELYGYVKQLREDTFRLRKMNHRLRKYGEKVDSVVRTEENLAARVKIHNDLGRVLLAAKAYIGGDAGVSENELLDLWRMNLAMMYGNAELSDEMPNAMDSLYKAADFLGVKVSVSGIVPKTESARKILIAAAKETLTNAARHGGADRLDITVGSIAGAYKAVYANNGAPADTISEGSGLGNLREMLENAGCTMQIVPSPQFRLIVTIPQDKEKSV